MIIRLNTKNGIKRINIEENCPLVAIKDIISHHLNIDSDDYQIFRDPARKHILESSELMTTGEILRNGDFLYIFEFEKRNECYDNFVGSSSGLTTNDISYTSDHNHSTKSIKMESPILKEDEVDLCLHKESGLIKRPFNPQLCRHLTSAKCVHCAPLEVFDPQYLSSLNPPLKHLPFHCYVRSLKSKAGGKDSYVTLETPNCNVKTDCGMHPSWPFASCNKCIPSAITLEHQSFRFIDNIMFHSHEMVNYFIDFWRKTGAQRMGFLYGYFDQLESFPLAIRSNIVAIYEPPQFNSSEVIELLDDPNEEKVTAMAEKLGLRKVGWIYTQLIPSRKPGCVVECCRNKETFFVSAQECITAATFQNRYKNVCRFSPSGYFGSKFVTVVISGNSDCQIDYSGWQMSVQAMALVESDCIVPTIDNPGLAYLRKSTNKQIVPDVFYNVTDQYNNTVTKIARPVPVDYFLVQVSVGFPIEEHPMLYFSSFPHINRQYCSEIPLLKDLNTILKTNDYDILWRNLKNFNVLLYMITQPESIYADVVLTLCDIFRKNDYDLFVDYLHSEHWNQMFATIIFNEISVSDGVGDTTPSNLKKNSRKRRTISPHTYVSMSKSSHNSFNSNNISGNISNEPIIVDENEYGEGNMEWACSICTYINSTIEKDTDNNVICTMCGIPRQS